MSRVKSDPFICSYKCQFFIFIGINANFFLFVCGSPCEFQWIQALKIFEIIFEVFNDIL